MNDEFVAAILGAVIGGFLATAGGIVSSLYMRRRAILDSLMQEIASATHGDLGPEFHRKSAKDFRDAIIRARPVINDKRFAKCMEMIRIYRNNAPSGLNPESLEYAVFCTYEKVDPRDYIIVFSQKLVSTASGSLFEVENTII